MGDRETAEVIDSQKLLATDTAVRYGVGGCNLLVDYLGLAEAAPCEDYDSTMARAAKRAAT
ncbi:MAG TPA: hypothetical protein VN380_08820 [Thermoanaerobaculia bacterium]|jgi:hypothetical protein|nr:hypothetical protein [Thermoanaerobaculia bacterium]